MGIKNSYKAFVGFEFSMGKFCKTTACFSIDRKVHPVGKTPVVRAEKEKEFQTAGNSANDSHIKEAVYSSIEEGADSTDTEFVGRLMDLSNHDLPKHIHQYLKTEQQFRYPKGEALDFLV